ncbi:hypothetical protein WMY93_006093 [Mugilogobius chulae]|uniref:Uncharacterized protein n=1 Tax=Mugilogobius chulae TaxID=88201 RepID=A0AAW0PQ60_9GOBI
MASRLVPDFSAVLVALEHIKELDKELRDEGVAFSPEASAHLSEITGAVTGLEAEGRTAHELLEVATIENSVLRHEMNLIRDQMSQVIMADVAAARASNAEEIEQLRKDLHHVSQIQESTVSKHDKVKSEIESQTFERDKVKAKHQEVIAALNDERTQKYAMQSHLDQTRQTIEDLKASIASCEHNTMTLQQDLTLEKEDFVKQREDLSKEENEEQIKHQEEALLESRRELDLLRENKRNGNDNLDDLRLQTIQLESSMQRLEASKSHSEKVLEAETKKYQELAAQKLALQKQLHDMNNDFDKVLADLKQKIANIEQNMVAARATRECLQDKFAKIYEVFKVTMRRRQK